MATIIWDGTGQRFYESGVDHCVLYPANEDGTYGNGIAWNGITSISEIWAKTITSCIWSSTPWPRLPRRALRPSTTALMQLPSAGK